MTSRQIGAVHVVLTGRVLVAGWNSVDVEQNARFALNMSLALSQYVNSVLRNVRQCRHLEWRLEAPEYHCHRQRR